MAGVLHRRERKEKRRAVGVRRGVKERKRGERVEKFTSEERDGGGGGAGVEAVAGGGWECMGEGERES